MMLRSTFSALVLMVVGLGAAVGQEPLHQRIDKAVLAGFKGPHAKPAGDEEFLRRIYLDLTGIIPTAQQARDFLKATEPNKRALLIDKLIQGPDFPRRMMEVFTVMFEERREVGDARDALWEEYLVSSFAANKPWDQLAREVLAADVKDAKNKAADKFYVDRGGDLHVITKDVGRLFLGRDIECSRCHDHPTVKEFLQRDYFGLYAFLNRSFLFAEGKSKGQFVEKFDKGEVDFSSVFTMEKMVTGAHLPGQKDIVEPTFAKGEEYLEKPDPKKKVVGTPKFSPRAVLAQKMTESARQSPFVRNAANRLWFVMLGRGVVHPLDMLHSANPADQAKLLDVLSEGLLEVKFDVKRFLKEIALSQTYQRSSLLPAKSDDIPLGAFAVAQLRSLSPEQLLYSIAQTAGVFKAQFEDAEQKLPKTEIEAKRNDPIWRAKAVRAAYAKQLGPLANALGIRKGEPEVEFQASMAGALYLANDRTLLAWFKADAKRMNLLARLDALPSADAIAEEMYLTALTRMPTAEEKTEVADHLKRRGAQRSAAMQELAWALIASTEFRLNH
jgi:hypothetical protein